MSLESPERLARYDNMVREMEEFTAAMKPLAQSLIPLKRALDKQGIQAEGRTVTVSTAEFPKAHDIGAKRCMGFELKWAP